MDRMALSICYLNFHLPMNDHLIASKAPNTRAVLLNTGTRIRCSSNLLMIRPENIMVTTRLLALAQPFPV